jgi:outer membrane protein OmpA-like peptidoglycan-associated protein
MIKFRLENLKIPHKAKHLVNAKTKKNGNIMRDTKSKKRNAVAIGVVGLASIMGVATVGLAIGTSLGGAKAPVSAETASPDWAKIAGDKLSSSGFAFASAAFAKGVLIIKGDANNADTRNAAFDAAKNSVLAAIAEKKLDGKSGILAFENQITINGEKVIEIPDATATLGDKPEKDACQSAYNTLLDGRVINFNSGSAMISDDSKPLLDGLSNVAIKCVGYVVEVGGHTDTKGDAGANQALSERRAQAVADYIIGKGVNATELKIKGYGETMPLDTSESEQADAKNRRIEFKGQEKPE